MKTVTKEKIINIAIITAIVIFEAVRVLWIGL